MPIFDARDFGANPNDNIDDTAAIQAALDAAQAAGGGQVYLASGTYTISGSGKASDGALRVHSNTEFYGDGMGKTILKLADGWSSKITGLIRTPVNQVTEDVVIRDLTLDGNRDNTSADVDGIMTGVLPGKDAHDSRILIERVEIHDVSRIAFNPHEQTHDLVIRDSVAHHNSWDGFIADFTVNAVYENNVAFENDRHGFNVVTHSNNTVLKNNVAYENGENGIVVQRGGGSRSIDGWEDMLNHDVLVENNEVFNNGSNGILIKQSESIQVINNTIYDNGADGIQLEGAHSSLVADNIITADMNGIEIRAYTGSLGGPGESYDNVIADNLIVAGRYALDENHDSTVNNVYSGNLIGAQPVSLNASAELSEEMDMVSYTPLSISATLPDHYESESKVVASVGPEIIPETPSAPEPEVVFEEPVVEESASVVKLAGVETLEPVSAAEEAPAPVENLVLRGDSKNNTLHGQDGDDTLKGRKGNDTLHGGNGDDYLEGNSGDDTLYGGMGADKLKGSGGVDTFAYNDISEGGDTIVDFRSNETIDISQVLDDAHGFDATRAFEDGFLRLAKKGSDVQLFIDMDGHGGDMEEQLFLTLDDVKMKHIDHDNFILPETAVPVIPDPVIEEPDVEAAAVVAPVIETPVIEEPVLVTPPAPEPEPVVVVSTDPLDLNGNSSDNTLIGQGGDDVLKGRGGDDVLYGGASDDALWGNDGDDILYGGAGNDTMKGGDGRDTFVFDESAFDGVDTIRDMRSNDMIEIRDVLFGYDPLEDAITDFVQVTSSGEDTILSIDSDGAANGENFVDVAVFDSPRGLGDLADMLENGSLLITNSDII